MKRFGVDEDIPIHEWSDDALEHLIHTMGHTASTEVQERPLRNKAIQLLQERGVDMKSAPGSTLFIRA